MKATISGISEDRRVQVIIIGMMSIGIAGYVCSAIIRFAGTRMTPWLRTF